MKSFEEIPGVAEHVEMADLDAGVDNGDDDLDRVTGEQMRKRTTLARRVENGVAIEPRRHSDIAKNLAVLVANCRMLKIRDVAQAAQRIENLVPVTLCDGVRDSRRKGRSSGKQVVPVARRVANIVLPQRHGSRQHARQCDRNGDARGELLADGQAQIGNSATKFVTVFSTAS